MVELSLNYNLYNLHLYEKFLNFVWYLGYASSTDLYTPV